MRAGDYVAVALRDLWRQPVRTGLTVVALVISTVILVTMAAMSIGGQQAIESQFGADDAQTLITVTPNKGAGALSPFGGVQQVNAEAAKLDDAAVAQLRALPHVVAASPRVQVWECDSFTVSGHSQQFVAQVEGAPSDADPALQAGRGFSPSDAKDVAIVGAAYAKELGVSPQALLGKTIRMTTQKGYRGSGASIPEAGATAQQNEAFNQSRTTLSARVIGVTGEGPDQNRLLIPLQWARAMRTARYAEAGGIKTVDQIARDGYTAIRVKARTQQDVRAVSENIEQLGYGQFSTLAQIERIRQFSATMWIIMGAVAMIAVIAAALGVVNTMLMIVSEQRYVIGIWRACGARRAFIVRLFLLEAAVLGLVGGSIGVAAGIGASGIVNQHVNSLLEAQGLAVADIAVTPLWLVAGTVMLTTAFGSMAGLYPAFRAAREDPSRTLSSGQ